MISVRSGLACLMGLFLNACGGDGGKLPLLPPDSSLNYTPPPPFTVSVPISPIVPTKTQYLTNFSIVPTLPAGLVLDSATGVISGTPTQVAATTTYTVSVPDGNSAITATLVITVNPLPSNGSAPRAVHTVLAFEKIVLDGTTNRVLSLDTRLGAGLWDATTGTLIAPLNQTCRPAGQCTLDGALAGPTVVIRQQTGWNTYSSVDGAPIAHLDVAPGFATAWTLASDGSYLVFSGTEGVQAITPQGMTLFTPRW
jgi:hypothetical protein